MLGQDGPEQNSAKMFNSKRRDFESSTLTSVDKTNDCVMNSERGAQLGAPTHPLVSVYNTAGDTWRAPARRLIQKHFATGV